MGNEKYSFLKQWFTFTLDDESTDLVYTCTNNHYIHTWLEKHGYTDFENIISKKDFDLFIQALNESSNFIPDDFDIHFPEKFIENYSLWNMDLSDYWESKIEYRKHIKEQIDKLFDKLFYYQEHLDNGGKGMLKYNIFYNY